MRLNQVTVPVLNIPRSIKWYTDLGLKLIVHTSDDYARFESPEGESTFSLHRVDKMPTGDGVWVYFEFPDKDAVLQKFTQFTGRNTARTEHVEQEPVDQRWLWYEARLKDPDGNMIILYHAGENRKNPPWRLKETEKL